MIGCARDLMHSFSLKPPIPHPGNLRFVHPREYGIIHVYDSFIVPLDIVGFGRIVKDNEGSWVLDFG